MGFSFSTAAAMIGVTFLIIFEIVSGGIFPMVSQVNDSYKELKGRLMTQDESNITLSDITDVGWYNNPWDYRKLIIIDHDQVTDDLTNYPVLIDITDNDLQLHAQVNGYDIIFVKNDNSGTFAHERELWDSATGHLVAWVNVTQIFKDIDTWFFMYYGNDAIAIDPQDPENVWDGNYTMVQHLEESAFVPVVYDSTQNNNDGTKVGDLKALPTGKIDGAYSFSAQEGGDLITVASLNNGGLGGPGPNYYEAGEFTISLWFKTTTINVCLISDWYSGPSVNGWHLSIDGVGVLYYQDASGITITQITGLHTVSDNQWHHVVVIDRGRTTITGKNTTIYLDGEIEKDASRGPKGTSSSRRFAIGSRYTSSGYTANFTGNIDEVQISNMGRDSEWIITNYNNMYAPSTFSSLESPQYQTSNTYLNMTVNNTGSETLRISQWTLLLNGNKTSFIYLQPYLYPEKTTTVLVNVLKFSSAAATYYSSSSDGTISKMSATYADAHDATSGTVTATSTAITIGQYFNPETVPPYYIYRGFVFFDTSSIPDTATITSATLSLYGQTDSSIDADFDITIQNGQPNSPHDPLVIWDYYYSNYSGNGGSINTASFTTSGYNDIIMTATGWISKTGTTKLCIRSSRDINSIDPGLGGSETEKFEYITVYSQEQGAGYKPKLTVAYTISSEGMIKIKIITENGKVDYGEITLV